MEEAGDGQEPKPPVKKSSRGWGWVRLIRHIKRQTHKRNAKKQKETPSDRAARRTANATVWMAAVTVILALIGGGTLWVLKNQLREMHEGGSDTHDLADAAKKQADRTKDLADAAKTSANAAQSAANTANETLKAARTSFVLEQRPYLIADTPRFGTSPAADGKALEVNVTFKNIGKTPAVKRRIFLGLLRFRGVRKTDDPVRDAKGRDIYFKFIEGAFRDLYKQAANPGGKYGPLAREDIAPGAQPFSTAVNQTPLTPQELIDLQTGELDLYLIGIVEYTDGFGEAYSTEFCSFYFGTDGTTWHICDSHNTIK